MPKKCKEVKKTRDARTGRFVKDGTEERRPATTVRETIKMPLKGGGCKTRKGH